MANVTRWNPFDEMLSLRPTNLFNRDFFNWLGNDTSGDVAWSPRCDVTEADGVMVIHAELPGVERKDMEISVEGGMLTVRGEKRTEKKQEEKGRTYSERFFGSFERSIAIPEGVDQAKIEADLKDGVLEVRIPMPAKAEAPAKQKIEIKDGA